LPRPGSVVLISPGRALQVLAEGGTGDLQQLARPLQDLHVLAQPAVLAAQLGQLLPLGAGQAATLAIPGIPPDLPDPVPHRRLSQIKVPKA
jgi:hypothetical protein